MIKLVINALRIAPGGGFSVLQGLLEYWSSPESGLDITILAGRDSVWKLLRKNEQNYVLKKMSIEDSYAAELWERYKLPGLLKRLRADVLLTNNYYVRNSPCPQVVHHQTLYSLFEPSVLSYLKMGPRRVLQTLWARNALQYAEANVFISEYLRNCAEKCIPTSASRNHVIYNGLTEDFVESADDPNFISPSVPTICALQSPDRHKDNESLLRVLAELRQTDMNTNWKLRIGGSGDWTKWYRRAKYLGIDDRVEFLGYLSMKEVKTLFRTSGCCVYPSVFEGFGMPIIEAMACGCPVIAVNATAIPEIADNAAILVPPHSPKQISQRVLQLYKDEHFRRQMIDRGKKRAVSFQWQTSASKFTKIFQNLINQTIGV